jgi:hypothetical protein
MRVKKILESGLDKLELEIRNSQMVLPIYEYSRSVEEFFGETASAEVRRC